MFFLVNFVSNNFFSATLMSPNTCAMMHGPSSYFHHTGFWLILILLVIFGVLAYKSLNQSKKK